jgi:hypothetical protein
VKYPAELAAEISDEKRITLNVPKKVSREASELQFKATLLPLRFGRSANQSNIDSAN